MQNTELSPNSLRQVEFRLPNAILPLAVPIIADLSSVLPPDLIPLETFHPYDWGRVERKGVVLRIVPEKPGEHQFRIEGGTAEGSHVSILCKLSVIADPKTLWKEVEPPADSLFSKPHMATMADSVWIGKKKGVCFRVVGASRRGRDHAHHGKFREDDFGFRCLKSSGVAILAVADGAGHDKYRFSREGSRVAVKGALDAAQTLLDRDNWLDSEAIGDALIQSAYAGFQSIVKMVEELNKTIFDAESSVEWTDFSTTLLLAAVKRESFGKLRIVTFSIGDGALAWVSQQQAKLICIPDHGDDPKSTLFLTSDVVWKEASNDLKAFRKRIFALDISAEEAQSGELILMTDGISDPLFETDEDLSNETQWHSFVDGLPETDEDHAGISSPQAEADRILEWLSFYKEGEHDDRTLLIFRPTKKSPLQGDSTNET